MLRFYRAGQAGIGPGGRGSRLSAVLSRHAPGLCRATLLERMARWAEFASSLEHRDPDTETWAIIADLERARILAGPGRNGQARQSRCSAISGTAARASPPAVTLPCSLRHRAAEQSDRACVKPDPPQLPRPYETKKAPS